MKKQKIMVCALEPSSNLHFKYLLEHLGDVEICGAYDPNVLPKQPPLYDVKEFSIMGFLAVLKKLPFLLEARKELASLSGNCDKVLLLDSSGFNLSLAKAIKKQNQKKKIIYFILPQAWAWKKWRMKTIARLVDYPVAILPFEQKLYPKADSFNEVFYFGHPLMDEIKQFKTQISNNGKMVLMPGSRESEIKRLFPIFKNVARKLNKKIVLVVPKHFDNIDIKRLYGKVDFEISTNAHEALFEADFALVCSGTATLEAALIGTPTILAYKTSLLEYAIAKLLVKGIKHVGLANIIFDFCAPKCKNLPFIDELLQNDVNEKNILEKIENLDSNAFLYNSFYLRSLLKKGCLKAVSNIIKSKVPKDTNKETQNESYDSTRLQPHCQ